MNTQSLKCIVAGLIALTVPVQLLAQQNRDHRGKHYQYKLVDLGTFGGPSSYFNDGNPPLSRILNNLGIAVGTADTAAADPYSPNCLTDCFVSHGFEWRNGTVTDLGALPGVNNSYALAINEHSLIVGVSENGVLDPLTGFPEINGVIWKDGAITNLGTFGGNQSFATGVNNHGQVVGAALNTIGDSFSPGFVGVPATTQAHAFLWQERVMRDLGTLGGPDSAAFYVNERGQVAGQSLTNSIPNATTGFPTQDPFLWVPCDRGRDRDDCRAESTTAKQGEMIDLGTLGGTFGFGRWPQQPRSGDWAI